MDVLTDLGFNNRAVALLIWFAIFGMWVARRPELRSSAGGILKTAFHPKIVVPCAILVANVSILCVLGSLVGLWNLALTKSTLFWFVGSGVVAYGMAVTANDYGYVSSVLAKAIGFTFLIEFFTNDLAVFPLVVELVLLPILLFLVMVEVVAGTDPQTLLIKRFIEGLLAVIGFAIFMFVVSEVATSWAFLDRSQIARELLLPLWMSLGVTPFLMLVGLLSAYEQVFFRLRFANRERRLTWRVRLALVGALNVRIREVSSLRHPWLREIVEASSIGDAWRAVRKYREEMRST